MSFLNHIAYSHGWRRCLLHIGIYYLLWKKQKQIEIYRTKFIFWSKNLYGEKKSFVKKSQLQHEFVRNDSKYDIKMDRSKPSFQFECKWNV